MTDFISKQPEYGIWYQMLSRCQNYRRKDFKHYGGRGIVVCERWLAYSNFIEDMGRRPYGPLNYWTLERIDNNQGYSKDNCKWATFKEQVRNKRTHGWNRLTPEQIRAIKNDPRRPYRVI